jgi:cell fate (sporulation/competence/biofilm development) regulator YmcA (YheA/YmcA/DUF963 family)
MNEVETALADLQEELQNSELVKEYFRLRKIIEENEEIRLLKQKINKAQVKLSLTMSDQSAHAKNKQEYEELVHDYESHPLINNFSLLQSEVRELLQNIADLLK